MSHCSRFNINFKDKHILFKAMRNLNMNPENQVWSSYKSNLGKMIGFHGSVIGKLLTGTFNGINIFFTEESQCFVMNVESHKFSIDQLSQASKNIAQLLQKEYTKCSLEKLQRDIIRTGEFASLTKEVREESDIYILTIGTSGRKLIVLINKDGEVLEEVHGVTGKSCIDLTFAFESCITDTIQRQWAPEYNETIEDRVIQVLNLV